MKSTSAQPQVNKSAAALQPVIKAASCGKTIIVGEHAVVYGAAAVAMPLKNHRMEISLQRKPDDGSKVVKNLLYLSEHKAPPHVQAVIDDAFHLLGVEPFSFDMHGHHSLPVGAGFGGSASLCTVVLRVLSQACGLHITQKDLAAYGREL